MRTFRLALITAIFGAIYTSSSAFAAGGKTLWKEFPRSSYGAKSRTVKVRQFKTAQECRRALTDEIISSQNVGNNIRYYCL